MLEVSVLMRVMQAIPSIEFKHLASASPVEIAEIKRRGVVVIRNVLPEEEALQLKADIRDYLRENSNAKGSPLFFIYFISPVLSLDIFNLHFVHKVEAPNR